MSNLHSRSLQKKKNKKSKPTDFCWHDKLIKKKEKGRNQQTLADIPNYKDIEDTIFLLKKMISRKEEHIKWAKKGTFFGRTDKIANETKQSDFLRGIIKTYRAKFYEW